MSTPTITDTLPFTSGTTNNVFNSASTASISQTYTVPAIGQHKLFVIMLHLGADKSASIAGTLNGQTITFVNKGVGDRAYNQYGYVANPSTGTLAITWTTATNCDFVCFTVQDAAQASLIDIDGLRNDAANVTTSALNLVTTVGNDLLLSNIITSGTASITHGASQVEILTAYTASLGAVSASYKPAGGSPATETVTENFTSGHDDHMGFAIKYIAPSNLAAGSLLLSLM